MVVLKMAFRNIFRHRRRSILTGMMMAGGCALFAVFIGIVEGSYGLLIDMFTRDRTGHIQVHAPGYLENPSIYKTLEDPEGVYTPALAFAGPKTTGVRVMGIDPVRETRTTRIKGKVARGGFISEANRDAVVISDGLSRVLGAGPGDEIAIIAQGVDGSVANGLFRVAGVTGPAGGSMGASDCYMHIEAAREFLSMGGRAHEIAVVLTDHRLAERAAARMRVKLKGRGLEAEPWQVVERQFYRAMQADIKGNWLTMLVLTIIIAVGVLNTVLMVILERTGEFGVLRALGTRPLQVFLLIVLETLYLAVLASAAGAAAGAFANWVLSVKGITLSTPVEYGGVVFDTILGRNTLQSVFLPPGIILASALLVSIPPGIRAARIQPVRAMRWT
jgi:ABC-type lipoprotein release transport system permease subunit